MLYFDDCDRLFDKFTLAPKTPHPRKEQRSVYQILCDVSNACVTEDLFVVYLSAKLALVDYSPYCLNSEKMQAPIVELPFDTFATVHEDNIKLEQVSEPGHMVQFGRPLSVNAVSFMACLLIQLKGSGRDGRRRILRGLMVYDVICFFSQRRRSWAGSVLTLLSAMANSLHLELGCCSNLRLFPNRQNERQDLLRGICASCILCRNIVNIFVVERLPNLFWPRRPLAS